MAHKIYLSPSDQTANKYAYGSTNEAVQCRRIFCATICARIGLHSSHSSRHNTVWQS